VENKSTRPAVIPESSQDDKAMEGDLATSVPAHAGQAVDCTSLYVFIAYDDRLAYGRALRTLAHVARALTDDGIELHPLPWRFDVLAEASWRALAVADAARAAIVMLSTSVAEVPLETIHAWLPECLGQRREPAPAVLALLGAPDHPDELESPRYQFVRNTARSAGCDFIAPIRLAADPTTLNVGTPAARL